MAFWSYEQHGNTMTCTLYFRCQAARESRSVEESSWGRKKRGEGVERSEEMFQVRVAHRRCSRVLREVMLAHLRMGFVAPRTIDEAGVGDREISASQAGIVRCMSKPDVESSRLAASNERLR